MILELLLLLSGIVLILILLTEYGKDKWPAVISSIIVLVLGSWMFMDGLQISNGYNTTANETQTQIGFSNGTLIGIDIGNTTTDGTNTNVTTVLNRSTIKDITTDVTIGRTETTRTNYLNMLWPFETIIKFGQFLGLFYTLLGLYVFYHYAFDFKGQAQSVWQKRQ